MNKIFFQIIREKVTQKFSKKNDRKFFIKFIINKVYFIYSMIYYKFCFKKILNFSFQKQIIVESLIF